MATIPANKIRPNTVLADGSKVYDIDTSVWDPNDLVIASVLNGHCKAMVVAKTHPVEIHD